MIKKLIRWAFRSSFEKEIKSHKRELRKIESIKRADADLLMQIDDSDQIPFYKDVADWGSHESAKKYGYLRMNSLLSKMTEIQAGEEHKFWIARGQMAELHQFLNLSLYTKQDYDDLRVQLSKPKDSKKESTLVDQYN